MKKIFRILTTNSPFSSEQSSWLSDKTWVIRFKIGCGSLETVFSIPVTTCMELSSPLNIGIGFASLRTKQAGRAVLFVAFRVPYRGILNKTMFFNELINY